VPRGATRDTRFRIPPYNPNSGNHTVANSRPYLLFFGVRQLELIVLGVRQLELIVLGVRQLELIVLGVRQLELIVLR
jgi:hypothetical protein